MAVDLPPEVIVKLSQHNIYLMGISFIIGSLSTIFILLILDMVHRIRGDVGVYADDEEISAQEPPQSSMADESAYDVLEEDEESHAP